jgi:hypothetical protein
VCGHRSVWLHGLNTETAGSLEPTGIAGYPYGFDRRPKRISTRQLAFNDRVLNGQTALYITPEVGVDPSAGASTVAAAQQIAVGFNANFIPQNFASLPGSGAVDYIFVFTNFNQGNLLASAPNPAGPGNTDTDYTPLWQVNLVSWIRGRPTALTSQADIATAAQNGFVSVQKTPIIVECSVIFTPRGGLLPLATVREEPAEEADRR